MPVVPPPTRPPSSALTRDAERTLIAKAQAGDDDSFSELYRAHIQPIYRYLLLRVRDHQQAEDLTAEVFLRVAQSIHHYQDRGSPFAAWLFRIARDRLVDHYRRSGRRPVADLNESIAASPGLDPQLSAEAREQWQQVTLAMSHLTNEQRDVIHFRFIEEWSLEHTAALMNKSVNAIKALQHRALNAINRHLAKSSPLSDDRA